MRGGSQKDPSVRVAFELLPFAQEPLTAALGKEPQSQTHPSTAQVSVQNDLNVPGRIKNQAVPKHFVCVFHVFKVV